MAALTIIFKRNQEKIVKMKEFNLALEIFQNITGSSV